MGSAPSAAQRATRTGRRLRQGREECRVAASRGLRVGAGGKLSASPWRSQTRPVQQAAHLRTQGPRRARHQTPRPCKRALGRGSLNVGRGSRFAAIRGQEKTWARCRRQRLARNTKLSRFGKAEKNAQSPPAAAFGPAQAAIRAHCRGLAVTSRPTIGSPANPRPASSSAPDLTPLVAGLGSR
jgi:hypothetical protein